MDIAQRIGEIFSAILSDRYDADIRITFRDKEEVDEDERNRTTQVGGTA